MLSTISTAHKRGLNVADSGLFFSPFHYSGLSGISLAALSGILEVLTTILRSYHWDIGDNLEEFLKLFSSVWCRDIVMLSEWPGPKQNILESILSSNITNMAIVLLKLKIN